MLAGVRRIAWIVAGLGLSVVGASCRQIVGIDERQVWMGGAGGPACTGFVAANACGQCTEKKCCDEIAACRDDAACARVFGCIGACALGDADCRSGCFTEFSPEIAALAACQSRDCELPCGIACGGLAASSNALMPASAACAQCLTKGCCAEVSACWRSEGCLGISACYRRCNPFDRACDEDCFEAFADAGSAEGYDIELCKQSSCRAACDIGQDWSCLGHVAWPTGAGGHLKFGVLVVDALTQIGIAKATVKACAPLDVNCSEPVWSSPTDAKGWASLEVDTGSTGFQGYVEISAPGYVDAIVAISPYVTRDVDKALPTLSMVKPDSLKQLAETGQFTLDLDNKGLLIATAQDCLRYFAPGVSFEAIPLDPASKPFYFDGTVPSLTATETTTPGAQGGFINVAPGLIKISAKVNALGGAVSSVTSTYVRANTITFVYAMPTPTL